jgi:hypothetical protein
MEGMMHWQKAKTNGWMKLAKAKAFFFLLLFFLILARNQKRERENGCSFFFCVTRVRRLCSIGEMQCQTIGLIKTKDSKSLCHH